MAKTLSEILHERRDDIVNTWAEIARNSSENYAKTEVSVEDSVVVFLEIVEDSVKGKWDKFNDFVEYIANLRVKEGFNLGEIMSMTSVGRNVIAPILAQECDNTANLVELCKQFELSLGRFEVDFSDRFETLAQAELRRLNAELEQKVKTITEQNEAILELSTPVVKVWDKVLSVPLIGTLDSPRTQLVMETLLQRIVDTQSRVVIVDISGIVTVDTLVANHIIKMVLATRLLGAECIVTGVNSQVAQTLVHLGVDLSGIITRPSMSDGIAMAFEIMNLKVVLK